MLRFTVYEHGVGDTRARACPACWRVAGPGAHVRAAGRGRAGPGVAPTTSRDPRFSTSYHGRTATHAATEHTVGRMDARSRRLRPTCC
eukprot:5377698-Prymnesium_polylepis.1